MKFVSTRGTCPPVDFRTALFQGLAPDGGLYLPERVPRLLGGDLHRFRTASLPEIAAAVSRLYVDLPDDELLDLCTAAFDFDVPLVEIEPGLHVLELFHGPTLAFKDFGARFMARLMGRLLRPAERLTILVATSGDTGGAVAQAFHGVPGTSVVVLYPRGKVTLIQEKQFTTLGDNVRAFAVDGTFDDCQRMVKESFADRELSEALQLTSANSINVGRLIPQSFYYFHAASRLEMEAEAAPPLFCVPSGNFGNLCAGLLAHRMGLACAGFLAATNTNDVVPEYLSTGSFSPRPSVATISNAMDVGNPSNFDRILHLYEGSRDRLLNDVRGSSHSDAETREEIRRVHDASGYVLDPHTAVGVLGLRSGRAAFPSAGTGVVLGTAHPAKFREEVEPMIGRKIALPAALASALEKETLAEPLGAATAELRRALLD